MKEWESKLAAVKTRKEDMNRLAMNFLVTEVRVLAPPYNMCGFFCPYLSDECY